MLAHLILRVGEWDDGLIFEPCCTTEVTCLQSCGSLTRHNIQKGSERKPGRERERERQTETKTERTKEKNRKGNKYKHKEIKKEREGRSWEGGTRSWYPLAFCCTSQMFLVLSDGFCHGSCVDAVSLAKLYFRACGATVWLAAESFVFCLRCFCILLLLVVFLVSVSLSPWFLEIVVAAGACYACVQVFVFAPLGCFDHSWWEALVFSKQELGGSFRFLPEMEWSSSVPLPGHIQREQTDCSYLWAAQFLCCFLWHQGQRSARHNLAWRIYGVAGSWLEVPRLWSYVL